MNECMPQAQYLLLVFTGVVCMFVALWIGLRRGKEIGRAEKQQELDRYKTTWGPWT